MVAAAPFSQIAYSQAMIEYGHLAGTAANASSGLNKASPKSTFRRLEQSLQGARTQARRGSSYSWSSPSVSGAVRDVRQAAAPLTVIDVQWGDKEPPAGGPKRDLAKTSQKKVVSAEAPIKNASAPPQDLEALGLSTGMPVAEVIDILGDPVVRTGGLDGYGYDEKRLHRLSPGWKITVYASRGRVIALRASPTAENSTYPVLRTAKSVVP